MATLRDTPIQPLDVILFRGSDPVSQAICFVQQKMLGRGDFSHAGIAVTRESLDLPCLEPGKVYVWESTLSAPAGFWSRFTDKVPDAETKHVRFGVQIRDLELVIPGYRSAGGDVAWCAYRGQRPPLAHLSAQLLALHEEYGHAAYTANLLDLFGVVYPALHGARDGLRRAHDRVADVVNALLARAQRETRLQDAEHHVFCSEWVGIIYEKLGLTKPDFDPLLAAPVTALLVDVFAPPVRLD
jgi:hypothetical protein